MSYRRLISWRTLRRPALLRHCSVSAECPLSRHYSVLVEGSGQANGKALPLLAQARTAVSSEVSDTKPKKTDLVVERKIVAYPPTHYFDTHKVVTALQQAGYSNGQAEAIVSLLTKSLQHSLEPLWASVITQKDMEVIEQRISAELKSVRDSLVLVERSAIDNLRNEMGGLKRKVQNLTDVFKEEVEKVKSGLQLDLNLEKSRIKEEATDLEQKVKDTNNRIAYEVALLKTQIESQKVESIKYLAGGIFSIVTIVLSVVLGMWRLMK